MAQLPLLLDLGHALIAGTLVGLQAVTMLCQHRDPLSDGLELPPGGRQLLLGVQHLPALTEVGQRRLCRGDPLALLSHGPADIRESTRQVTALHSKLLEQAVALVELAAQPATAIQDIRPTSSRGLELYPQAPGSIPSLPQRLGHLAVLGEEAGQRPLESLAGEAVGQGVRQRTLQLLLGVYPRLIGLVQALLQLRHKLGSSRGELAKELEMVSGLARGGAQFGAPGELGLAGADELELHLAFGQALSDPLEARLGLGLGLGLTPFLHRSAELLELLPQWLAAGAQVIAGGQGKLEGLPDRAGALELGLVGGLCRHDPWLELGLGTLALLEGLSQGG